MKKKENQNVFNVKAQKLIITGIAKTAVRI